ncbi:DUF4177 domain-containing protein [Actinomycetospora termitidis]|uniref:DUF4177 domain-containing protein n=1 Tax=Actinomycetospora termitidis TaxID=3053470 RepID=A0ABT7MG08_9PSEU|nr:DUF4177 domain-containing protein [Actinomycetospora sp. Odt1-22]MDL5159089.1 DUF4177 domain-containing protein [Actinomycetospora sp. Odt1-22]
MDNRFQYKVLTYKLGWKGFKYEQMEQDLNELGAQGWDTVSTLAPSYGQGQTLDVAVILKRTVG